MNEALKMQISAYVDGELSSAEAELLTRRLSRDATLREQAGRYLAIGRLMRGERELLQAGELRSRIASAVESEAIAPVTVAAPGKRYTRPLAGVAIAASVAVLALFGLQRAELPGVQPPLPVADQAAGEAPGYTVPGALAIDTGEPGELLKQYYLSHGATSGDLGANGILSRLVTLELREGELVETPAGGEAGLESPAAQDDNSATDDAQEE